MIPKIIHYCWFGGAKKPQNIQKNIEHWRMKLPDYRIIEWNESNFDVNYNDFTREAYEQKKYAFVSDIARLYALQTMGGIYLDTDVEVLRSFDDLLSRDYFLGREYSGVIGTATIGACQGCQFIKEFLETYRSRHFINQDGTQCTTPNVVHLTEFINVSYPELEIFDMYYFSPKHPATRVCKKKDYTYCIHHFDGSWLSEDILKKRSEEGKRLRRREIKKKVVSTFIPWDTAKKLKYKFEKYTPSVLEIIHFLILFSIIEYLYKVTLGSYFNVYTEHALNICFDISVLLFICTLIAWFRKRIAFVIANIFVFIYAIINIGYFRVFGAYPTPSVATEISNLNGLDIFSFIREIYKPSDLITIVLLIINIFIITRFRKNKIKKKHAITYPLLALFFFVSFQFLNPIQRSIRQHTKLAFPTYNECIGERFNARWCFGTNMLIYEFGIVRTQLYFGVTSLFRSTVTLSDDDITLINNTYLNSEPAIDLSKNIKGKNIVFILVESLLSSSLNHEIDGHRITPCIDSLLNIDDTWSNLKVKPNISVGMSSDGQFILFTGLLPMKNSITVKSILDKEMIGFPQLLKDSLHYETAITIPTHPGVWHQSECSKIYGFGVENTTCTEPNMPWGTDKEIFEKAITIDKQLRAPYFHCILTSSTHSAYDHRPKGVDYLELSYPKEYSTEYRNYLSECHYMDAQIGNYINSLKKEKLWDKTVLIIIADHHAQTQFLNMTRQQVREDETPIIIVNAQLKDVESVTGTVNQADIYSSLLDLCGITSEWRGFGKSIFRPEEYKDNISDSQYLLSEKMINSNFFKNYYKE